MVTLGTTAVPRGWGLPMERLLRGVGTSGDQASCRLLLLASEEGPPCPADLVTPAADTAPLGGLLALVPPQQDIQRLSTRRVRQHGEMDGADLYHWPRSRTSPTRRYGAGRSSSPWTQAWLSLGRVPGDHVGVPDGHAQLVDSAPIEEKVQSDATKANEGDTNQAHHHHQHDPVVPGALGGPRDRCSAASEAACVGCWRGDCMLRGHHEQPQRG
jgi:hypothetical protein